MSKTRLRGAFLLALVFTAFTFLIIGDVRFVTTNPFAMLAVAVFGLAVGYYLWPTATFIGDLYRDRGYSLHPSFLRVAWSIAMATVAVLIGVLFSRLRGDPMLWTDLLRAAVIGGAWIYLIYLPPRDGVEMTRSAR